MAPSEFWNMRPRHFWWLLETLKPKDTKRGMSETEARELLEWMDKTNGAPRSESSHRR